MNVYVNNENQTQVIINKDGYIMNGSTVTGLPCQYGCEENVVIEYVEGGIVVTDVLDNKTKFELFV